MAKFDAIDEHKKLKSGNVEPYDTIRDENEGTYRGEEREDTTCDPRLVIQKVADCTISYY